ncbi:MAG: hypothetical protein ACKO2G_13580 [Verrucomicrobiales bacterium]
MAKPPSRPKLPTARPGLDHGHPRRQDSSEAKDHGGYLAIGLAVLLVLGAIGFLMSRPKPVKQTAAVPVAALPPAAPEVAVVTPDFVHPPVAEAPEEVAQAPQVAPQPEEETPKSGDEKDPRLAIFKEQLHLMTPLANRQSNLDNLSLAIHVAVETGEWKGFQEFLERGFHDAIQKVALRTGVDRFNALLAEPLFRRAMDLQGFAQAVDESFLRELANNSPEHEFYFWLLEKNPDALADLLQSADGSADLTRVLKGWSSIWAAEEKTELRDKYAALALACALVFPEDDYGNPDSRANTRYRLFRDNSEKGRLTGRIHRMKSTALIWVVDVPVDDSEIEWALKKMHLPQKRWGEAYGMIEYLMERAVNGLNPYEAYTFEQILEHGGVCADQSYFSANTAKCHGIPATIVSGDGDRGPHAWIVYMPDEDTWAEAGNVGYTTGTTNHPVTGERMHQSMLTMTTDRGTRSERLEKTTVYLRFMKLFLGLGQNAIAEEALDLALRNTPEHPMPWKAAIAYHEDERSKTTLAKWEELADTIRRRFRDRPDFLRLAEGIEDDHVFPHRDAKDNARDVARERRRLDRDTDTGRTDLLTASIEREADILATAKNFDGISSLYRKSFQDFGDKPEAFRVMASQYFGYAATDPVWMEKACREIELAYKRHIETDDKEYFRVTAELTVLRQVAGFYEKAGDVKKAALLRDRADRREKLAKRSAL